MDNNFESFAAAVEAQTDERVNEILENARTLADEIIAAYHIQGGAGLKEISAEETYRA